MNQIDFARRVNDFLLFESLDSPLDIAGQVDRLVDLYVECGGTLDQLEHSLLTGYIFYAVHRMGLPIALRLADRLQLKLG